MGVRDPPHSKEDILTGKMVSLVQENKKGSFFKGVKDEFKKISWPAKKDLFRSTKIVVISTFVFAGGIYLTDLVVRGGLNWINVLVHRIMG